MASGVKQLALVILASTAGMSSGFAQGVSGGVDLSTPRIKDGGLAIWVGNKSYRDCQIEDVSLDGQKVTFSSGGNYFTVTWSQVAPQSRMQVMGEYKALLAEKTKAAEALIKPAATPTPVQPTQTQPTTAPTGAQKIHIMVAKVLANNSVIGERYEPKEAGGNELSATGKMIFLEGLTEAPPTGQILEVNATRGSDLNGPSYLPSSVEAWVAVKH
jgi:hypothetical protein